MKESHKRVLESFGLALVLLTIESYIFFIISTAYLSVPFGQSVQAYIGYVLIPYVLIALGTVIALIGHAIVPETGTSLAS